MSESNTYMMIGERLCLDFANTVGWHDSEDRANEWFTSYEKLVNWSFQAEILTAEKAQFLLQQAEQHPSKAEKILQQTIELREAIFRLFRSIAMEEVPNPEDTTILNKAVARHYQTLQLAAGETHFSLVFQGVDDALDGMIPVIVQSTIELLTSEKEMKRVKLCEGHECGWLFFDTSRNRSRRWCSMADCGNRAKARRFYQSKK